MEQEKAKNLGLVQAFKEAQAWNESQLHQWVTVFAQKEDDNQALQLYCRQDEATVKDLSKSLERWAPFLVCCLPKHSNVSWQKTITASIWK